MFLILGGGFGLYGYLPALVHGCGQTVLLPRRYQQRLLQREDVRALQSHVVWVEGEQQGLACASAVVVSKRPQDQVDWVEQCLQHPTLCELILEKPLAPSPTQAHALMDRLERSGKNFRLAYIFRYTHWGQALARQLKLAQASTALHVDWCFLAHHYAHKLENWKRVHAQGGGALRFYGIHLVALLAELGYRDTIRSTLCAATPDDVQSWHATLSGPGLPPCHLRVECNSPVSRFCVRLAAQEDLTLADMQDPFASNVTSADPMPFDGRVALLTRICQSLQQPSSAFYPWYRDTLTLWAQIELQSSHQHIDLGI